MYGEGVVAARSGGEIQLGWRLREEVGKEGPTEWGQVQDCWSSGQVESGELRQAARASSPVES